MLYLFLETFLMQLVVAALFCALGIWIGRRMPSLVPEAAVAGGEGSGVSAASEPAPTIVAKSGADEKFVEREELEIAEAKLRQLRLLNDKLMAELDAREGEEGAEGALDAPEAEPEKEETLGPEAEADDLEKLRGIGKVMAEKLEKLGVTTYRQIAKWSRDEINKLPFKSRVARDKWQEQAKRFHKEKYGEKL